MSDTTDTQAPGTIVLPQRIVLIGGPAPRQRPRMLGFAIVIGLLHLAGFYGWREARAINRAILHPHPPTLPALPRPVDQVLASRSDRYFANPCSIGHQETCEHDSGNESIGIEILRDRPPSQTIRTFLSAHHYDSELSLLNELAMRGHDDDVALLAGHSSLLRTSEGTTALLNFAYETYLRPALWYADVGNQDAAISAYRRFVEIGVVAPAAGYWVSGNGVDLTDIPVLQKLFCNRSDSLDQQRCTWGLFDALDQALSRNLHYADADFPTRTIDLAPAYASEPEAFRDPDLSVYLQAASLSSNGVPASGYDTLVAHPFGRESGKEVARQYLLGRLALAASRVGGTACTAWLQRARDHLQAVMGSTMNPPFFRTPAANKMRDLQEKPPC